VRGTKKKSKRKFNTSFLHHWTVNALQKDFDDKMKPELGGDLLIQTCRYGKMRRQNALLINRGKVDYLHSVLDYAWGMITSSYVAHIPKKYPTGLWDVAHSNWIITLHGRAGYFWICYCPEVGSALPMELSEFDGEKRHNTIGIAATILLLQLLSENIGDEILHHEITALKETIKSQHPQVVEAAENWLKRIYKENTAKKTASDSTKVQLVHPKIAATA